MRKYGGDTFTKPFSKKLKLNIFSDQQSKVLYNLILLYAKLRTVKIYSNRAIIKKPKRGLGLASLPYFPHDF